MSVARSVGSVAAASSSRSSVAVGQQLVGRADALGRAVDRLDHEDLLELGQLVSDLEELLEEAGVLEDGHLGARRARPGTTISSGDDEL